MGFFPRERKKKMKTYLTIMTVALLALVAGSAHASFTGVSSTSSSYVWALVGNSGNTQYAPVGIGPQTAYAVVGTPPTAPWASANDTIGWDGTTISSTGSAAYNSGVIAQPWCQATAQTAVVFTLLQGSAVLLTGSFENLNSANISGTSGVGWFGAGTNPNLHWTGYLPAGNYQIGFTVSGDTANNGFGSWNGSYDFELTPVPEPISMVMLGCLGAGMAVARKLRRKKA
jgi:hypothetical protein